MAEYINVGYTLSMFRNLRQIICLGMVFAFLANTFGPLPVYAQEFALPAPGQMVGLSPAYSPVVLKGIKLDPRNPFRFNFFVDRGDSSLSQEELKSESSKLIKYFLASLTIPEKDLWVNLSPYEKDRIVPREFGQTEMGRDLLAEDYLLKQITASLIYPESQLGKEFWNKVYTKAVAKYGTTNIPINTFNKVWIVPEKAVVYENGGVAFVLENHLKVMLEQDYLSLAKHEGIQSSLVSVKYANQLGSEIVREVVIPALTKEVNEGKNFTQLRQVFYSLILATWYKKKIKDSILNRVYSNQNKIGGVNVSAQDKDRIYQEYLRAFKKGVYNYIKEEPDQITGQTVPRKYFSGGVLGVNLDAAMLYEETRQVSSKQLAGVGNAQVVEVSGNFDFAMNLSRVSKQMDGAMNAQRKSAFLTQAEILDSILNSPPALNASQIQSRLKILGKKYRSVIRRFIASSTLDGHGQYYTNPSGWRLNKKRIYEDNIYEFSLVQRTENVGQEDQFLIAFDKDGSLKMFFPGALKMQLRFHPSQAAGVGQVNQDAFQFRAYKEGSEDLKKLIRERFSAFMARWPGKWGEAPDKAFERRMRGGANVSDAMFPGDIDHKAFEKFIKDQTQRIRLEMDQFREDFPAFLQSCRDIYQSNMTVSLFDNKNEFGLNVAEEYSYRQLDMRSPFKLLTMLDRAVESVSNMLLLDRKNAKNPENQAMTGLRGKESRDGAMKAELDKFISLFPSKKLLYSIAGKYKIKYEFDLKSDDSVALDIADESNRGAETDKKTVLFKIQTDIDEKLINILKLAQNNEALILPSMPSLSVIKAMVEELPFEVELTELKNNQVIIVKGHSSGVDNLTLNRLFHALRLREGNLHTHPAATVAQTISEHIIGIPGVRVPEVFSILPSSLDLRSEWPDGYSAIAGPAGITVYQIHQMMPNARKRMLVGSGTDIMGAIEDQNAFSSICYAYSVDLLLSEKFLSFSDVESSLARFGVYVGLHNWNNQNDNNISSLISELSTKVWKSERPGDIGSIGLFLISPRINMPSDTDVEKAHQELHMAQEAIKNEHDPFQKELYQLIINAVGNLDHLIGESEYSYFLPMLVSSWIDNGVSLWKESQGGRNSEVKVTVDGAMTVAYQKRLVSPVMLNNTPVLKDRAGFASLMLSDYPIESKKFQEILADLRSMNRSGPKYKIYEIKDGLPEMAQLRKLVDLHFEIDLVLLDDASNGRRWMLEVGEETNTAMKEFQEYYKQGRVLIDIHVHPNVLSDGYYFGDMNLPSLDDLRFYVEYCNYSLILAENGVSFIKAPILNPLTGKPLEDYRHDDFYDLFARWGAQKYGEKYILEEFSEHLKKRYQEFMRACGVVYEFLGWGFSDEIRRLLIREVDKESNPLLKKDFPIRTFQAEVFIEQRYRYILGDNFDNTASVEQEIYMAYAYGSRKSIAGHPTQEEFIQALPWTLDQKRQMLLIDAYNKNHPDESLVFDKAMSGVSSPGGIDLNPAQMSMQVKKSGEDFKFDFNDTEIDAAQVTGATFTIRTITPVTNLLEELGLNIEPANKLKQEALVKV